MTTRIKHWARRIGIQRDRDGGWNSSSKSFLQIGNNNAAHVQLEPAFYGAKVDVYSASSSDGFKQTSGIRVRANNHGDRAAVTSRLHSNRLSRMPVHPRTPPPGHCCKRLKVSPRSQIRSSGTDAGAVGGDFYAQASSRRYARSRREPMGNAGKCFVVQRIHRDQRDRRQLASATL